MAERRDEIRDTARRAHVLLQPRDERDVRGADCVARERGAERCEAVAGIDPVPRQDARIEGDPEHALFRRIGALDRLGRDSVETGECERRGEHQERGSH